jgi:Trp operon repressor
MAPQDPESLARQLRMQRICRELSHLLQTSVEQRQVIEELLAKLEEVTRGSAPLVRTAGRSTTGVSPG